ncbi:PAS domain-containing protein [bacterium]|nr:PAS domain-containing protein [bacterium]
MSDTGPQANAQQLNDWLVAGLEAAQSLVFEVNPLTQTGAFVGDIRKLVGDGPGAEMGVFEALSTYMHPDDQVWVVEDLHKATVPGAKLDVTYRVAHPRTGEQQWFRSTGKAEADADGKFARIVGVIRNVTSEQRARQANAALRERFESAVLAANVGTFTLWPGTGRMEFDDQAARSMQIDAPERDWPVERMLQRIAAEDFEHASQALMAVAADGVSRESRFRLAGSEDNPRWMMARARGSQMRDGVCERVSGTVWDVTDLVRERAEAARVKALLEEALKATGSVAFEFDPATNSAEFIGDIRQRLGLDAQGSVPSFEETTQYVLPEDLPGFLAAMQGACVPGGTLDFQFAHRHVASGETRWARVMGGSELDDNGQFRALVGIIRDVTQEVLAERAYRELDSRFHMAMQAAGIGTWTYEVDSGKLFVDERLAEVGGFDVDALGGNLDEFMALVAEHDQARVNGELAALIEDGKSRDIRFERVREDGEPAWFHARINAAETIDGQVKQVSGATWDITKLVRAEQTEALFRERHNLALQSAKVGCWYWDGVSDEFEIDPWTETLLGFAPGEMTLTMEGFLGAIYPEDRARMAEAVATILAERDAFEEIYRVQNNFDAPHWMRSYGKVFRDASGAVKGLSGVLIDVTTEVELRHALERSNAELDDFAHIASHDLREPLRGLHNYASFLQEDYGDVIDGEGKHMLGSLGRLAQRLEDLINDLQSYSRLGRSELNIKPIPLADIVDDVLGTMEFSLDEAGVALTTGADLPTVVCDRTRIGEVLRNLVTNAIKYNDKDDKTIEIGFEAGQQAVFVRDNGIGIAPEHADRVFAMFKRLHTREAFSGGTGAGLTLTKRMVERHGGRIWFESEPGSGTTFYFTLGAGAHE